MPAVLLVRPAYDPASRSTPAFPWALLFLAAELAKRGVDVDIVDEAAMPDAHARAETLLASRKPVAVGITSMTGEQIRHGLAFARLVRRSGRTPIVWGGIHASLLPEQTARHELVDYVVAGEGEIAFADLVDCLAHGKSPSDIPGVYLKRNDHVLGGPRGEPIDLATLPEIPFDLIDVERYVTRRPDLGAERYFEVCTSRGCPHRCGFCYIESVHGSRWRALDANAAVDRIKDMVRRFDLDAILFREDNFFVNRDRVEAIARRLIAERLGIKWAASCRVNYFAKYSSDFIRLLRDSGCVLLTFGVESGSDRVLEFVRKGIHVDIVLETAAALEESRIRGAYHFMGGFPSETVPEFLDTCRLIDRIRREAPHSVVREMSIFAPYPGVGLIPECVRRGYREPEDLDGWIRMDWANPRRPWLTPAQSRLLGDAQFLIARLAHPNPLLRAWAQARWHRLVSGANGIVLRERPLIEYVRRLVRR